MCAADCLLGSFVLHLNRPWACWLNWMIANLFHRLAQNTISTLYMEYTAWALVWRWGYDVFFHPIVCPPSSCSVGTCMRKPKLSPRAAAVEPSSSAARYCCQVSH